MRHWLLHPLIFYPLALIAAALLIGFSLKPQAWPRPAAPVAGASVEGVLVLEGEALGAPEAAPGQRVFVARDFWGAASLLRIASDAGLEAPGPNDAGVRILLAPEAARHIAGPVRVEVSYNPVPVTPASALAVRLEGGEGGPGAWTLANLAPEPGAAVFDLPAAAAPSALALRAIAPASDQVYGLEITRIRVLPRVPAPRRAASD